MENKKPIVRQSDRMKKLEKAGAERLGTDQFPDFDLKKYLKTHLIILVPFFCLMWSIVIIILWLIN